ncbi:Methyltransferase domain-containing protein [Bacillus sp. OV322]|uniref:class I SAM-dependent methyltransferase n=1 Tax=Bacillus sp. OV322 TaxID=1882764 RepID=UPI0008E95B0A|nr:class I SAM-dependent methyltransferase [Bacillus sp. OV322]SFC55409.1 Methyltransferase domain-containing protein [Bacillus sp. OV322]
MKEAISTYDDILVMLDHLLKEQSKFNWDHFYSERDRGVPFFVNSPDENLVSYFENKILRRGKVLELGCGPGRNAIYFAEMGCSVDAVDLSQESLQWARVRAIEKNASVNFINENIFELKIAEGEYDIIYDSGCFHHIAPHRRMSYINLVRKALRPDGFFALTCFITGGEHGGAEISDWDVYRTMSLKGGLGYTEEKLRGIFNEFKEIEIRDMLELDPANHLFGVKGLLTALFQK